MSSPGQSTEARHPPARGRVLLVTSSFPRWEGDSSTPFVQNFAIDLQSLGWEVDVLAPHAEGAKLSETMAGLNVRRFRYWYPESGQTVCYEGGALMRLRTSKVNALKVPALVTSELAACIVGLGRGYHLINSHWLLPQGWAAGIASRLRGVPHVATVHGGDVFALRAGSLLAFKRWALRMSDAVTVNSSATSAVVRGLEPDAKVQRIPMGAAVSAPNAGEVARIRREYRIGTGPLIVFVGRLIEEKGAGDLISALPSIHRSRPDATAVVVGEGPFRQELEARVRALDITKYVHFAGWVDSGVVTNYLAAADVFVGPSKRSPQGWVEALGLTFIEAALAGTPIVATRTGGVEDMVRHEETGLLVSEGDSEAIAHAVLRLAAEPSLATLLATRAKRHAESNFTRRASAESFSDLFLATLRHRSS